MSNSTELSNTSDYANHSLREKYASFAEVITVLTRGSLVFVISVMSTLVFMQVITRYVFHNTPPFMSELATYCLIWTASFGSSLAFRYGKHVSVEFLTDKLQNKPAKILKAITTFLLIGFLLIFLFASTHFAISMWQQTSATMSISMTWPALGLPLGTILMIIQVVDVLICKKE